MAGRKVGVSRAARRADLVLVDARLSPDGRRVTVARGYERRGEVWTDLLIFDRGSLARHLKDGKAVFTGRPSDLPGDFELLARVHLREGDDSIHASTSTGTAKNDDLGLPRF